MASPISKNGHQKTWLTKWGPPHFIEKTWNQKNMVNQWGPSDKKKVTTKILSTKEGPPCHFQNKQTQLKHG